MSKKKAIKHQVKQKKSSIKEISHEDIINELYAYPVQYIKKDLLLSVFYTIVIVGVLLFLSFRFGNT